MAWSIKSAAASPAVVAASPSFADIMSSQAVEQDNEVAAALVQRQLDREAEKERREEAEAIALVAALVEQGGEIGDVSPESIAASVAETAASAAAAKQEELDRDLAMALRLQAEEQALFSRKPNIVIGGSAPSRFARRRGGNGDGDDDDDDDDLDEESSSSKHYKAKHFKQRNKHDHALNKALNAKRLEEWDGELDVGCLDGLGGIGGKVFNQLKSHAKSRVVKGIHVADRGAAEDHKTRQGVIDKQTEILLLKLVNNGTLGQVGGVVKSGKEASVFACRGSAETGDCGGVIAKVFRTAGVNEFRNRGDYIRSDSRFNGRKFNIHNPRRALALWSEKEYRNLSRLHSHGLQGRVPEPLSFKKHVLLMRMITEYANPKSASSAAAVTPAPQLKEVEKALSSKLSRARDAGYQLLALIKAMWKCCGLVHGDLSEYNVLYQVEMVQPSAAEKKTGMEKAKANTKAKAKAKAKARGKLVIIDVGQAVEKTSDAALQLLHRDVNNALAFLRRVGLRCPSTEAVVQWVVGEGQDGVPSGEEVWMAQDALIAKAKAETDQLKGKEGVDDDDDEDDEEEEEEEEEERDSFAAFLRDARRKLKLKRL